MGSDEFVFGTVVPAGIFQLELLPATWPVETVAPIVREPDSKTRTVSEASVPRHLHERLVLIAAERGITTDAALAAAVNMGLRALRPRKEWQ